MAMLFTCCYFTGKLRIPAADEPPPLLICCRNSKNSEIFPVLS